jgi:hypothetical protein
MSRLIPCPYPDCERAFKNVAGLSCHTRSQHVGPPPPPGQLAVPMLDVEVSRAGSEDDVVATQRTPLYRQHFSYFCI